VTVLCIAGSATAEAVENGSVVGKSGDEPEARVEGELLKGSVVDVHNVQQLVASRYEMLSLIKPGPKLSKEEVRKNVLKAMEAERAVIYYSGHGGRQEGGWCFESEGEQEWYLFDELMYDWCESACKSLVVVIDACFSGWWVEMAKERDISAFEGNKTSLEICASCSPQEKSWGTADGGAFTVAMLHRAQGRCDIGVMEMEGDPDGVKLGAIECQTPMRFIQGDTKMSEWLKYLLGCEDVDVCPVDGYMSMGSEFRLYPHEA